MKGHRLVITAGSCVTLGVSAGDIVGGTVCWTVGLGVGSRVVGNFVGWRISIIIVGVIV